MRSVIGQSLKMAVIRPLQNMTFFNGQALTVLKAVELPAGIANLATRLPNVDGDALTLQ
jgi:hypothetical protein